MSLSAHRSIRHGVFETNSSSSHALAIRFVDNVIVTGCGLAVTDFYAPRASDDFERRKTDLEGKTFTRCLVLTGGEFGWGDEKHTDTLTKANYLAQHLAEHADDDPDRLMLTRVLLEACPAAETVVYDPRGYIDHQSRGYADVAFESEHVLRNYLFNPASTLIISNDNGGLFGDEASEERDLEHQIEAYREMTHIQAELGAKIEGDTRLNHGK